MKIVTERNEWNQVLQQFPNINDVYFNYDYFNIYKCHFNAEPEAIVWENKYISIFWSHLVREVPHKAGSNRNFFDLITPYGYGGPLISYKDSDKAKIRESLDQFMKEYIEFARKKNYICEFIRFHPILNNWEPFLEGFQKTITLEHINDTVQIDLTKNLDQIWQELRKGHKYNIKKTERENCEVKLFENPSDADIDAFISLYHETMKNNCASNKYFFTPSFIKDHFTRLSTILIRVDYCGQLIGASMFIAGNTFVHYHLSGSNKDYKGVYPSELIIWAAIKWAKEREFRIFHLGGGLRKNDPLFNFKKGFSQITAPFFTGKIIFNSEHYEQFTNFNKPLKTHYDFFPAYRSEKSETII